MKINLKNTKSIEGTIPSSLNSPSVMNAIMETESGFSESGTLDIGLMIEADYVDEPFSIEIENIGLITCKIRFSWTTGYTQGPGTVSEITSAVRNLEWNGDIIDCSINVGHCSWIGTNIHTAISYSFAYHEKDENGNYVYDDDGNIQIVHCIRVYILNKSVIVNYIDNY